MTQENRTPSEKFAKAVNNVMAVAATNKLETTYKPDFHDELDFIIDLGTEAVDYATLENPTCTNLASFIVVRLPEVVHDEDELEKINAKTGGSVTIPEMVDNYNFVAQQLMKGNPPQYLLGVNNGHVDALMWCVWE